MGSWGYHSHQNDATWDYLIAENIHEMTDREVVNTLKTFIKKRPIPEYISNQTFSWFQTFLGLVVHCLFQGRKIPRVQLVRAKKITDMFLDPTICSWKSNGIDDPEVKINILEEERRAIEYALKNGGKCKPKHCPTVLEQIGNICQ